MMRADKSKIGTKIKYGKYGNLERIWETQLKNSNSAKKTMETRIWETQLKNSIIFSYAYKPKS